MFISRAPLRISLGGGGTDLPSYYRKNKGFLISAAIDKYIYVTIMKPFSKGIYSSIIISVSGKLNKSSVDFNI